MLAWASSWNKAIAKLKLWGKMGGRRNYTSYELNTQGRQGLFPLWLFQVLITHQILSILSSQILLLTLSVLSHNHTAPSLKGYTVSSLCPIQSILHPSTWLEDALPMLVANWKVSMACPPHRLWFILFRETLQLNMAPPLFFTTYISHYFAPSRTISLFIP